MTGIEFFFQMKHHALFDGEITKMHRQIEKSFSPEALCQLNQTWHKNSLGEGNLYCSNDGPRFFPRGYNRQTAKILDEIKKSSQEPVS